LHISVDMNRGSRDHEGTGHGAASGESGVGGKIQGIELEDTRGCVTMHTWQQI